MNKKLLLAIFATCGCVLVILCALSIVAVFFFFPGPNGGYPAKLYQTCLSAPNSIGCEACLDADTVISPQEYDGSNPFIVTTEEGPTDKQVCSFCESQYYQVTMGELDQSSIFSACTE